MTVKAPETQIVTHWKVACDGGEGALGHPRVWLEIDERGYVDLVSNRFTKEQELMTLELALLDRQIAVQTLVGDGLPTVPTTDAPR